jgi:hypothetical protein
MRHRTAVAPWKPVAGPRDASLALWLVFKSDFPAPVFASGTIVKWARVQSGSARPSGFVAVNRLAKPLVHRRDMLDQCLMLTAQAFELVGEVKCGQDRKVY